MAEKKRSTKSGTSGAAGKKTGADRAVPSNKKPKTKSETAADRAVQEMAFEQSGIPGRIIAGIICLVLFVIFLVVLLKPDGWLLMLVRDLVQGLIGRVGFYISIPALLYAFTILLFSGKRPIAGRLVSLGAFTFLCGTLAHVAMNPILEESFLRKVSFLYQGGALGTSGGVLCGFAGIGVRWLFGSVFSYIVLIIGMILTLLGAFQITIPGIVRAIRSRPRDEFEEDDEDDAPIDNSAVIVNHFADKHAERTRQRREAAKAREEAPRIDIPVEPVPVKPPKRAGKKSSVDPDFMDQVNTDPSTPIGGETVPAEEPPEVPDPLPMPEPEPQEPGGDMPPLELDPIPVPAAPEPVPTPVEPAPTEPAPQSRKQTAKDKEDSVDVVEREIRKKKEAEAEAEPVEYCYPPIDLLGKPAKGSADGTDEMRENSRRLNDTLASFKIEAHIVNVTRGPSVTRYEVELEKGVRLSKLTGCADDIALSLGASGVRIAAVPGKISVVGIEVPNRSVTTVSLREVIDSHEFHRARSKSSFAVGKDIGGNCIVGNIAKLPHMLIAGTTGSGKSVCMNSIIISLLYKASPQDVKLIMVDPKMVELGIYNGIPHLLIPVVTDPKKAAGSLQWAVNEMLRRYKAMSDVGVRDLESYNSIIDSQGEDGEHLPQVVVIIDELADLMLVAAKEVEESICRIAQMGRAAGIHLIIATQRPSADVITGLMKANIPSRIAFAVASAMDSRIILDTQGAEKLVGKGDMLYAPIGCGKPMRVQGCFVTDGEVEAVATYIKEHYTTSYDQQVMSEIEKNAKQAGTSKSQSASDPMPNADEQAHDELLPDAVDVVLETGQASVSMLQRRLKLGYARAARIVDEMEEMGIVGPFQGSKPRAILITKEQWAASRGGESPAPDQMSFSDFPEQPVDDESDEEDFD